MNIYHAVRRAGRPHHIHISMLSNLVFMFIGIPVIISASIRIGEGSYLGALMCAIVGIIAVDGLAAFYIGVCQAAFRIDKDPNTPAQRTGKMATIDAITDYFFWPNTIIVFANAYALLATKAAAVPEFWAAATLPIAVGIIWTAAHTEARWGTRYIVAKADQPFPDDSPQQRQAVAKAGRIGTYTKIAGVGMVAIAVMMLMKNFPMVYPTFLATAGFAIITAGRIPNARLRHRQQYASTT